MKRSSGRRLKIKSPSKVVWSRLCWPCSSTTLSYIPQSTLYYMKSIVVIFHLTFVQNAFNYSQLEQSPTLVEDKNVCCSVFNIIFRDLFCSHFSFVDFLLVDFLPLLSCYFFHCNIVQLWIWFCFKIQSSPQKVGHLTTSEADYCNFIRFLPLPRYKTCLQGFNFTIAQFAPDINLFSSSFLATCQRFDCYVRVTRQMLLLLSKISQISMLEIVYSL